MVEMRVSQRQYSDMSAAALIAKVNVNKQATKQKQDMKEKKDLSKVKFFTCGETDHYKIKYTKNLKKNINEQAEAVWCCIDTSDR